jgi:hypothetical protein
MTFAGVLKQDGSKCPNTIYAANSQMVVSAGFSGSITTGILVNERISSRSSKGSRNCQNTPVLRQHDSLTMWKSTLFCHYKSPLLPCSSRNPTPVQTLNAQITYHKGEAWALAESIPVWSGFVGGNRSALSGVVSPF